MEKENKKSEWKQQYQKRKGYFKEYYQKHKDVMDANNKKNAKKYREEYKHLKEENKKLKEEVKKWKMVADENGTHYDMLEEENKKLKDEFMLRLAEVFLLPLNSNQMAEYKQWNYSKWYDEIKNQMRKEIKEGK